MRLHKNCIRFPDYVSTGKHLNTYPIKKSTDFTFGSSVFLKSSYARNEWGSLSSPRSSHLAKPIVYSAYGYFKAKAFLAYSIEDVVELAEVVADLDCLDFKASTLGAWWPLFNR